MSELKACPFCGSCNVDIRQEFQCTSWEAVCEDCGAVIYRDTYKDALQAWNSRASEDFARSWGERLSEGFTENMHRRVCENSKNIYTVMRETCAILDCLLCEEVYHEGLTVQVRGKLARLLRMIDGADEQV